WWWPLTSARRTTASSNISNYSPWPVQTLTVMDVLCLAVEMNKLVPVAESLQFKDAQAVGLIETA
ncbi:MAG TPA: hypothetical protein VH234_01995, partial [Candidatus Saccharimonadales bacterium]|nr:hypothetical protein [Candidatus Saccharimonadales bacterium]